MGSKIRSILTLLRIRQYYKNALVFVSLFFSKNLFNFSLYMPLILGFIVMCCVSSFNYIVNDIIDIENDKKHLEKLKKKPLASGDLPVIFAVIILILLVIIVVFSLIFLIPNMEFTIMIIFIVITGQAYNNLFKNYAFIDVLILSMGYLWRALAGCFIIREFISAWLFLVIFEIAMFLSIAKRKGDLLFLGEEKALEHKKVFDLYSKSLLDQFHVMISSSLFMTYSLYLILKFNLFEPESINFWEYMAVFTIPILFYILMRYTYLISANPKIARNPERAFFDKGIIIAGIIFLGILIVAFYFDQLISILNIL